MDWSTEKRCFHTFAQECAKFYCIQHDPFLNDSSVQIDSCADAVKNVLTPGTSNTPEATTDIISSLSSLPVTSTSSVAHSDVALSCSSLDQQQGDSTSMAAGFLGHTKRCAWKWSREYVLLPALRNSLVPLCNMATDGSVLQIADLHELYRVFERC